MGRFIKFIGMARAQKKKSETPKEKKVKKNVEPKHEIGDVIVHNPELNKDSIVSFKEWLNLDDSWELVGLYNIKTFEEEEAFDGDYVILANGHTLIISPNDYDKVKDHWEQVDIIQKDTTD